jgi:hypothetical protein
MREYQLGDDEVAILSIDRQRRIAAEITDTLLRNLPGVDSKAADACARNIAAAFGEYGVNEERREVDYDVPVEMMRAYLKDTEGK